MSIFTAIVAVCAVSLGFNPPEDAVGSVTTRIEAPETVAETGPMGVRVALSSAGDKALSGTVRLKATEPWTVTPDSADWRLEAGGDAVLDFEVLVAEGSYDAHYAVHAYVEFDENGKRQEAHPIALIKALTGSHRPALPVMEWAPVAVRASSSVSLARLPVRRVVVQVFGEKPVTTTVGWRGLEARTKAVVDPGITVSRPESIEAIGIHPPYHNGLLGTAFVEFPIELPPGEPARFSAATAIRDSNEGEPQSDGVTFQVRVAPFEAPDGQLGESLFERHSDSKDWEGLEVDLSRFAGQAIRLQLESHPGPKNDPTCDASYWGEPVVTVGAPGASDAVKPEPAVELGSIKADGRVFKVRAAPGARGLLDGSVEFSDGDAAVAFKGFDARVLKDTLGADSTLNALESAVREPAERGLKYRHTFSSWRGRFDFVIHLYVEDEQALRAELRVENEPAPEPWSVVYLEHLSAGPWTATARAVYAGLGNVIVEPEAFELGFDGHQLASSFVGFDFMPEISIVQAVDSPPSRLEVNPERRTYSLHGALNHTMTFIPAASAWNGVAVWRDIAGMQPAPCVDQLAGRFVFDLWGGRYAESADALRKSFDYGMTNSAVVWHNFQRWGYDYRLPEIWPPNPQFGTQEDFRKLADVCREHGVLFAPHDNYIDIYPDSSAFSYDNVAFNAFGTPVLGWFNSGRKSQAYRWLTDAYLPYLKQNITAIGEDTAATAYFTDVWSSIGPFDSWTRDGSFIDRRTTRDAWAEAFNWIRDELGDAPQISESGHDQLIGSLDGATANHLPVEPNRPKDASWVWPVNCRDAERIPWLDFAYHDRFVLHGAGYDPRYRGRLDAENHGIYSDDYICTEVLTGHPAMMSHAFNRDGVRKYWLLDGLMSALAGARMRGVEFVGDDIHRQRVWWENGAEVWVNRGKTDWTVAGRVLPPFGFYARSGGVEAAIERIDGVITEWSRKPGFFYVNARQVAVEGRGNPERKKIDFGGVVTNGGLRLMLEDGEVVETPLPDEPEYVVERTATL